MDYRVGRQDGRPWRLIPRAHASPGPVDVRAFDGALADQGGVFDTRGFCDDVYECVGDLVWRAQSLLNQLQFAEIPTFTRSLYNIVNHPRVNGYCRLRDDTAYVGVSYGLVQRTYAAAHAMMCLPEFLPDLGHAPPISENMRVAVAATVFPANARLGAPPKPTKLDPPSTVFAPLVCDNIDRRWAAHAVAGAILQWVLYHEWFHAASGHYTLATQKTGSPTLCLYEFESPSALVPEVGHLLEFDADRRAGWRIADELVGDQMLLTVLKAGTLSLEERFDAWHCMLASTLLALTDPNDSDIRDRAASHPYPGVRFWCLFSRMDTHYKNAAPQHSAGFESSFRRSRDILKALGKFTRRRDDPFNAWIQRNDEIIEEHNRLNDTTSSKLLPLVKPHDVFQILSRTPY